MPQSRKAIFFTLFFLSGFSGLIYQSIWSHYLKLFLGHAAYAQTLVLAIFMGGMALGSLASGFFLHRWKGLLIGYAVVEAIIGVLAIIFHPVFISVTDLTFAHLISGLGHTPVAVIAIKWGVAALLIFPQSVLLGMTFPLMVGGILRQFPEKPGYTLSMLYFTNSFGAVFGVLASSFVLIGRVGLPGTMLTAGLINIALAIAVWSLAKNYSHVAKEAVVEKSPPTDVQGSAPILPSVLLLIAFFTGLSSFMYEIGWIRMLVLVLGGSTHSFELMLASFILGIALGGLWIRNRIDTFGDSRVFLGYVQIFMGLAAVLSVVLYYYSFDWMSYILGSIQRQDSTYVAYLILSGLIAIVIMLPATFCAGMTLPLITRLIIKSKKKENGIGYVYSANTLGAIVGIFLSVHVIMPMFGLKNLIMIGALTDLALGLYLLGIKPSRYVSLPTFRKSFAAVSVALFAMSLLFVKYDVERMSSGVYRSGIAGNTGVGLYHSDGKTSTVTVSDIDDVRVIKNNGKPDASIVMDPERPRGSDEPTQILIAAYPLLQKPEAKSAAIIGMGSGMTTHTILASSAIESVDTIEMEGKVFEGARFFLPMNERAYNDPRSHLYVEDAKTFFSSHDKKYDIIVSEPPNPWVSGVATLFSQEFYSRVKRHLNPDGIFAQWIHLYEIDVTLLATVFNALDAELEDYVVYRTSVGDIVIMASSSGQLPPLNATALDFEDLASLLDEIDLSKFADLELKRIGSKNILSPGFRQLIDVANSDYFPILDGGAPRARYSGASASQVTGLINSSIPLLAFLDGKRVANLDQYSVDTVDEFVLEKKRLLALRDELINSENSLMKVSVVSKSKDAVLAEHTLSNCATAPEDALDTLTDLGYRVVPLLTKEEQRPLWDYIGTFSCIAGPQKDKDVALWYRLFKSTSEYDFNTMASVSTSLLATDNYDTDVKKLSYLLSVGMLADINLGNVEFAKSRWDARKDKFNKQTMFFPMMVLVSNLGIKI